MDPCECTSIASWSRHFSTKKDIPVIALGSNISILKQTFSARDRGACTRISPINRTAMRRFCLGLRRR
jgi:uncharacterized NAD(P)/FAD-binding protein YdhS